MCAVPGSYGVGDVGAVCRGGFGGTMPAGIGWVGAMGCRRGPVGVKPARMVVAVDSERVYLDRCVGVDRARNVDGCRLGLCR